MRKEEGPAWNKDFSRRVKNAGAMDRLELLEFKEQDGISRLIYRGRFARETRRLAVVLNMTKKIPAVSLSTE